jgi:TusA-related sulfurtransferase/uncharacterized OsmC-like protein
MLVTQTSVHIRTISSASTLADWAGHRTLTTGRPDLEGGVELGYSGSELLLLAVGAGYCDDLVREAVQRAIAIQSVHIDVQCEWKGEPLRTQHITCAVMVEAEASEADILDLIQHTGQIAEVPNTLRQGTAVTIGSMRAVSSVPQQLPADAGVPAADAMLEMLGATDEPLSTCALLTPAIKAKLRELEGGQVLEVRVDDPGAREDIAAWCRLTGNELLAVVDEMPKYTRYFVSKKHG